MLRSEFAGSVLGVSGRFLNVIEWPNGGLANQQFVAERRRLDERSRIQAKLRFDDNCKNGHSTFSITATIYDNRGEDIGGGCCHDDIVRAYPEFAPLIKWHLVSTDGPMHYVANTCYLAGKARELDSARRVAVWPDATDDQLSAPRQVLEGLLLDRLPGLLEEFKSAMVECGFIYK